MLKKLRIIIGIVFIITLCAGLSACKKSGAFDKYDVLVYYDANGGSFGGIAGVTIVDGFKFSDYETDENGNYHFKLLDPTSEARPAKDKRILDKTQSFNLGWYKTRKSQTDEDGNLLDAEGNSLIEVEGVYYVKGTENDESPVTSEPYYTYDDKWDFENDEFVVNPQNGKAELRLYAGWVPYYFFNYYVQEKGEWVKYGETYFNYENLMKEDSEYYDRNTIWTPEWNEGVMDHDHSYNKGTYTFPKYDGHTFVAAYTDPECTDKIDGSFVHEGTLDVEHAIAINRVQNIYVQFEDGVKYRIEKAEQLSKNVSLNGQYTILDNLAFTDTVKWPAAFVTGTFNGTFVAAEGEITVTGVSIAFNNQSAEYGGLFGRIGAGAVVKGIKFVDVGLDIQETYRRQNCTIGLFSGDINEKATVENITVNGTIRLGKIYNDAVTTCSLNMLVNGENKNGVSVSADGVNLEIYGYLANDGVNYRFDVDPDLTTIDESNGEVKIVYTGGGADGQRQQDSYTKTWRQ